MSAFRIAVAAVVAMAAGAGLVDIRSELVGDRVVAPALRFVRDRLDAGRDAGVIGIVRSRLPWLLIITLTAALAVSVIGMPVVMKKLAARLAN